MVIVVFILLIVIVAVIANIIITVMTIFIVPSSWWFTRAAVLPRGSFQYLYVPVLLLLPPLPTMLLLLLLLLLFLPLLLLLLLPLPPLLPLLLLLLHGSLYYCSGCCFFRPHNTAVCNFFIVVINVLASAPRLCRRSDGTSCRMARDEKGTPTATAATAATVLCRHPPRLLCGRSHLITLTSVNRHRLLLPETKELAVVDVADVVAGVAADTKLLLA